MTNASVNQTVTDVNSEGQAVKVVQVASNAEQIAAAGIGLVTAGPLGAVAAWGTLKAFAGKWTPWTLTGVLWLLPCPRCGSADWSWTWCCLPGRFQRGLQRVSAKQ